ncbi:gustatory receptor family protein [Aeromonas sp. BIGb0445]|uniref:gustatory receptor family protein n=1 Tax=Aeromonas sp. BIGb0445 TaxID=2940593 RepID=UPI002167D52A|nr:gustatory receptor family protein [Aeromonas sp. BIGb0445]MCS3460225.1 esterase/lipase [Aeromonas sp. BIGb0445]
MSRWIESFNHHAYRAAWINIIEISNEIAVDDDTIVTSVEEVARFIKVVVFINELLSACDPELIPTSTWDNFHSQSNACLTQIQHYQNNRNIAHVTNANASLDNLLTYIRPYQVVAGKAAQSASASFTAYTRAINKNLISFQEKASATLKEIENIKDMAINDADESDAAKTRIKELETRYFDDSEYESLSSKINNLEKALEESYEIIQDYKTRLVGGDTDSNSISSEIDSVFKAANHNSKVIFDLLNEVKPKLSDFKLFHTVVFGEKNEEGVLEGGLKSELSTRKEHLEQFKKQQEVKYKTLNDEIESLLPGATSAGLASAYYDLKVSFDNPIRNYSKLFYGSILFLMLIAFISITQEMGWFYIKFVNTTDLTKLFSNFLYKLPLIIPILWLTLFASKRRSEALRLQQEYAHKEALAKSYQSFKTQIDALGQSDPDLMNKLLRSAIDAVSKNASDTLDKKHGDNTPAHDGIDGLVSSLEKIKKILLP